MLPFLISICFLLLSCKAIDDNSVQPLPPVDKFEGTVEHFSNEEAEIRNSSCRHQELNTEDVFVYKNGTLLLKAYDLIFPPHLAVLVDNTVNVCFHRSEDLVQYIVTVCDSFVYGEEDFTSLLDGQVQIDKLVLEPGTFYLREDGKLEVCAEEYEDIPYNDTSPAPYLHHSNLVIIYIGNIGSAISIVALTAHLILFFLVPTLRNLPGCSLASLSVAFLLAYLSLLISQIPEVLGTSCFVFAVLQQYFFLAAFCCMNTMAFDVWRTLKMATTQLMITTESRKRRQFLIYSIYSWGVPFAICTSSVVLDFVGDVPDWLRPRFAVDDSCWMTNDTAKNYLFSIPAFTMFCVNAVFYVLSAIIIKRNTMKSTSDELKQTARLNFVLYVRLGLLMGITWLFALFSYLTQSRVVWTIFEVLNSLQGLFVFLLFSCSKKVLKGLKEKIEMHSFQGTKTSTFENKTSSSN